MLTAAEDAGRSLVNYRPTPKAREASTPKVLFATPASLAGCLRQKGIIRRSDKMTIFNLINFR